VFISRSWQWSFWQRSSLGQPANERIFVSHPIGLNARDNIVIESLTFFLGAAAFLELAAFFADFFLLVAFFLGADLAFLVV
jgi:hypothetical protein